MIWEPGLGGLALVVRRVDCWTHRGPLQCIGYEIIKIQSLARFVLLARGVLYSGYTNQRPEVLHAFE
jgi:hypothetical protein